MQLPPEVTKEKTKLTLIVPGAGALGCDVRQRIVTRGIIQNVAAFAYAGGRKLYNLEAVLQRGAILLRGHEESRPLFESHLRTATGFSMMIDGVGGRFVDFENEGAEALIAYLRKHLLLHTLGPLIRVSLVKPTREADGRPIADPDFKAKLLAGLGPPLDFDAVPLPAKTNPRKSLLTAVMVRNLRKNHAKSPPEPLIKLFSPEGSATWLVCGMEEANDDTLWAICDVGMGYVEYGPVSLEELETARTKLLKLPMERDRHFDKPTMSFEEILKLKSLTELK